MLGQDTQRALYAKYRACSQQARQEISKTEEYNTKLKRALAQHKSKYRRRDLTNLQNQTDTQVDITCQESLQPLKAAATISCQTELDRYRLAFDALGEVLRNCKEDVGQDSWETILDLKADCITTRRKFQLCKKRFFDQLRSEA